MKKTTLEFLMLLIVALVSLTACSESEDEEEEFANWQEKNETYFTNIYNTAKANIAAGDTSWKIIRKWSLNESTATNNYDHIVVHVLTEGTGSGCPLFTDTVKISYAGRLIPSKTYTDGYVFDKTYYGSYSDATTSQLTLGVNGTDTYKTSSGTTSKTTASTIDGMTMALMEMHIGDRWEVYIPYQLGYGTSASSSIPAYSTLIFDMTLFSYWHAGAKQ